VMRRGAGAHTQARHEQVQRHLNPDWLVISRRRTLLVEWARRRFDAARMLRRVT
jgi:hypothetical protein